MFRRPLWLVLLDSDAGCDGLFCLFLVSHKLMNRRKRLIPSNTPPAIPTDLPTGPTATPIRPPPIDAASEFRDSESPGTEEPLVIDATATAADSTEATATDPNRQPQQPPPTQVTQA